MSLFLQVPVGEKKICIPTDLEVRISNMKSNFWKNHKKAFKKQHKNLGVLDFTVPYPKSAKANFPPTNAKMFRKTS